MRNKAIENIKVFKRIIIKGKLSLESPLVIGSGERQNIDIVVMKDSNGIPYIPATSMVGALRHFFYERLILDNDTSQYDFFWGFSNEWDSSDGNRSKKSNRINNREILNYQSAFSIEDLKPLNTPLVRVRDGIRIDHVTGIAEDKKKFDYEVVEPGAEFEFNAQILIKEDFLKDTYYKIITSLVYAINKGFISLGALTTKGFGRCCLNQYEIYEYDFSKKEDVFAWLKREMSEKQKILLDFNNMYKLKDNEFILEATFNIKNSFVIKSYSGNPEDPDTVHIKSNRKNVLPGTSIKGTLRSRAVKIINTLGGPGEELINELFGWAGEELDGSSKKIKSRLIVEETYIDNVIEEVQYRTCIDRFTGGVITGALFDTKPLWSDESRIDKNSGEQVKINIRILDWEPWEVGLLLLLLKDLWTSDLPLGGDKNIGRGVLQGINAKINIGNSLKYEICNELKDKTKTKDEMELKYKVEVKDEELGKKHIIPGQKDAVLRENDIVLSIRGREEMEQFVQAFVEKCGNKV